VNIDSIIRHAITPPAFDRTKLHRPHLVDLIHSNIPKKLIAVAAPPGYGKTTLLADFTENTDLPVCWVRLTDADRDVMRFVTMLAASLQKRFRRLKNEPNLEILFGASPDALARTFALLIDERVSETFVIALDDVHLVNRSKPVMQFLDTWLEVQPEQVTMIAAGREVLEVSLAKLMADGDLAGLGPHNLGLTRDELIKLSKMHSGVELNEIEAGRLLEETRGWVTGVILSGILSRNVMTALAQTSEHMVYEYLASVVLNRQPDDVRRFMLDSAVLPVMTAEACDHVLKSDSSQNFLRRLVREGYFVTASGDSPRMYEYHPQFRKFLLETSEEIDEERLKELRIRSARYLEKFGNPEHAVDIYFDAKAYRRAAALATKQAVTMFRMGRIQTIEDWTKKIEENNAIAPNIFLYLAKAQTDKGDLDSAEKTLQKAREMMQDKLVKGLITEIECQQGFIEYRRRNYEKLLETIERIAAVKPKRARKEVKLALLRINALAEGFGRKNYEKAVDLAREAAELLEEGDDRYNLATTLVDLSLYQSALGHALEAHTTSMRAHEILEEIGAPLPLATSFNNLAVDAHLQGRFEEALRLFNEGIKFSRQGGSLSWEALILFGQADLFNDLGLPLQAAELYGQGLRIATQLNNRELIRYGCVQTSVMHRRRGTGDLPHQWLKRAVALGGGEVESPDVRIQLAALEMSTSPERTQEVLGELLKSDESGLDANQRTLSNYFLAKAYYVDGRLENANRTLETLSSWVGTYGTEQLVAAELIVDEAFLEFVRMRLLGSPVMSTILHRLEMIQGLSQQYKRTGDEPVVTPQIIFKTLGEVDILRGAERLVDLKPLAREILIYLVDNKRVDRDVLLEVFWPSYSPGRQVSNLYTAIYSLRRALGKDAVTLDGSVYGMNADLLINFDVARFERAADVAESLPLGDPRRFFALTEAINSYGGIFMAEFTSDWVVDRRRSLEFRFLELLIDHADEAVIKNQPSRALASLRRALSIDPYRDDINMRYLETLGLLERRSEIVAHYQQYIQLLSTELGLDPPESVRELYARLIG
jgi:ATP/maltotriose-dependent transcriptional regulator MalT/DNA-binding SARP family transcriptional activator